MVAFPVIAPALPEMFMVGAALVLLMVGVFRGDGSSRLVGGLAVAALVVAGGLVAFHTSGRIEAFFGMFVVDGFGRFTKILVLLGSAATIVLSYGYGEREDTQRPEFPVLILLSGVGMMMMISANDLISLYMGLETQSLVLYVLAAFRRQAAQSSEAGLKYFMLGALSSGLLLFGASLVYGFTGTTAFDKISVVLTAITHGPNPHANSGIVIGMVFMMAGLTFKVAAVPFHMWAPDVYEGAPTPVTAFFSVAPKVAALALLLRVLIEPFGSLTHQWREVVMVMSIASMLVGSLGAIQQTNIKRLMAYGSIGHIGYLMIGLATGNELGVRGILVYAAVYVVMSIGSFAVILAMRSKGKMVENIAHFAGLSRTHPLLAAVMAVFMFSMAGVPPLAGFFGKLYVFLAAIEAHMYPLAIIGVLTSVVSAFYYLRIIKLMYFDEAPEEVIDPQDDKWITYVLAGTAAFNLLFFIVPVPILNAAASAAASLFPKAATAALLIAG